MQWAWRTVCRSCGQPRGVAAGPVIALEDGSIHDAAPVIALEDGSARDARSEPTGSETEMAQPLPFDVLPSEEYESKLAQRVYSEENRMLRRARWQEEAEGRRAAREGKGGGRGNDASLGVLAFRGLRGGRLDASPSSRIIYIADLPEDVTDDLIFTVFGAYGTVLSCKTMQAKFQGQKGAALIRLASATEAQAVINATNGQTPLGLRGPVRTIKENELRSASGNGPQSAQQEQYERLGVRGGKHFLGQSKSAWDCMVAPALTEHVAKNLERDAGIAKQTRKAREERALARK